MVAPSKRHYLRSQHNVISAKKLLFNAMYIAHISTSSQVLLLSQQSGGYNLMGCTVVDIRNYKRDAFKEIREYDASLLIEHFE